MVKLVLVFLLLMVLIAMLGQAFLKNLRPRVAKPLRCPQCGRHKIGAARCDCDKG